MRSTKLGHLKRLGVNAVQIMPAMEFAGDVSWGYNPAHIFAIESAYGGPEGFKAFIEAAHRSGIAVILDVVYNHFGPSDLDLWQFDGWSENDKGGIYFYNDWRSDTPWGDTRPDYGRSEVRQFIRDNALYWLEEYHLDGLRFDMTLYIRSVRGDEGDEGDALEEGWSLLQWINARDRRALSRTHHHRRGPAQPGRDHCRDRGRRRGLRRAVGLAVRASDPRGADRAARRGAAHGDGRPRAHPSLQRRRVSPGDLHRVPRRGGERQGAHPARDRARAIPSHWAAQKRSTLGAALMFTAPGIPMLFQGQEFLQGDWFQDTVPLDWDQSETFRGIVRLYRDLIRLRLNRGGVTRGLTGHGIAVHRIDEERKLVAFHRWHEGGPGDDVVVVANFSHEARGVYRIGFPREGLWKLRLNTDWSGYSEDFGGLESQGCRGGSGQECDGMPWSAEVAVGPYGALIFSQDDGGKPAA